MEFSPQITQSPGTSGIYDSRHHHSDVRSISRRFRIKGISSNFSIFLEYIVQNPSIRILVTIFGSSLNRIRQNRLTLQK